MLRTLLGLVAGAAVGLGGLYAWQWLGHVIVPFHTMDPLDPGKREILAGMSFAAQAWVIGGYAVGVGLGGLIGNWITDARWPSVFIAMMVVGIYFVTLTTAPHPFWMQVTGIVLPLAAGLAVAARVGRRTLIET